MRQHSQEWISGVVADAKGHIFDLKEYAAVGMDGGRRIPLKVDETAPLPHGSELMYLPQRRPVLYHIRKERFETVEKNPYRPSEPVYPVAAFNSPGYITQLVSAYEERTQARLLPLFSYGAVGWSKGNFRSAVILVDREKRQDLRYMREKDVRAGVARMRKKLPGNRLRQHLETCALRYGCPAGKNFFLGRYEAPLPTAQACNAECLGCLSLQPAQQISCSQERIAFTPTPEEISEIALTHIQRVKKSIVSFGQGCEGDPLLAAGVIAPAIRRIRAHTDRGTIHMNSNGSLPGVLRQLFDAGLDSVRISINSLRPACYNAYFQPKGYAFQDVMKSIFLAKDHGKHVALNYLNLPGFTDTAEETESLFALLRQDVIDMIQWRNLNFDPMHYWRLMQKIAPGGKPLGMKHVLQTVRRCFPKVKNGYFNPPKELF